MFLYILKLSVHRHLGFWAKIGMYVWFLTLYELHKKTGLSGPSAKALGNAVIIIL
jgi:hypothetical protein